MNLCVMSGRLVRDPEVRYTAGEQQMAVANFTVAVNRRHRSNGEQEADFISCVAFRQSAEYLEKHGRQGDQIVVRGEWRTGSYVNKDGVKVYTNTLNADSVELHKSGKTANSQNAQAPGTGGELPDGFMNVPDGVDDDGLPLN